MSRQKKIAIWCAACILLAALLAAGVFLVVIQTDWFKNQVRQRIIAETERATGGRVEIGRFDYNWYSLTADVSPFVLHGKEASSEPPLFRADQVQVVLKIISAFKRQVDIESLRVEKPQAYVVVAADGTTNVPTPKLPQTGKNAMERLLDLKIQKLALRDGSAEYNSHRMPLDLDAKGFQASLAYDLTRARYTGSASASDVKAGSPRIQAPATFSFDTKVALERNRIQVDELNLSSLGWKIHAAGGVENLSSPRAALALQASAAVKELKKTFGLKLDATGDVAFDGRATVESAPFGYNAQGRVSGKGLGVSANGVSIRDASLAANADVGPSKLTLTDLQLSALHGSFRGTGALDDWKKFSISGTAKDFALHDLARSNGRDIGELNGILSGPVKVTGVLAGSAVRDVVADAQLNIDPTPGTAPVRGFFAVDYDQRAGQIRLGASNLTLNSSQVTVSGTLGQRLAVHLTSNNLNDFLPLFPLIDSTAPEQLPAELHGGSLMLDATVNGPLADPQVSGKTDITKLRLGQRDFDHVAAIFSANRSTATFQSLSVAQGNMRLDGQGRVGLHDWKLEDSSTIGGNITLKGADIPTLAAEAGITSPVTGTASATVRVSGTFESPVASAALDAQNVTAYGEHFDTIRGNVTISETSLEASDLELRMGAARITLKGAYNHTAHTWNDGSLRFDVATSGVNVAQIQHVKDLRPGLAGDLVVNASGTAKVVKGVLDLTSLNGRVAWQNAAIDSISYGSVDLTANTKLPVLSATLNINLGLMQVHGTGEWRMEGDYPGQARIEIPRVPFGVLHELVPHIRQQLPFDGFLEGVATLSGPLNNPAATKADITLTNVQLNARPTAQPSAGAQLQDLVLRNSEPVQLEATMKAIDLRSAHFTAKDTTLNASGRLALDTKSAWDLSAEGRINLTILQIFNPDLLATGASVVNMTVRGPLTDPQVDGRLELQNASLFLRDVPNGVSDANGLILFDRSRATVQNLTATTGGGKVTFEPGSFVGFRGTPVLYRLNATAENVRYRSPDGVSVTINAGLALNGTSDNSVLSGSMTVTRAVFNPRTDVGSLLAATARPVSQPLTTNEYLRGIQFDVRVVSAVSLQVETSLTRNIQADINLRVRGTTERPSILGEISVSAGEIEFFGNHYIINRGEVNFFNPARIEPVIDMDLETKVRGITVDVSFSGPLNKLNFSYRSDPPLEANEIIALLAVGRTPSAVGPLGSTQSTSNTSFLATGGNAMLGQAIQPITGRLQKLFGVSHIKIDPQLTDITTIPQARLTYEQQVSTDVTLTYIQNLAVTNLQIVRLEWDFNKSWSVVALRDENGAFSIDFQFKKHFK